MSGKHTFEIFLRLTEPQARRLAEQTVEAPIFPKTPANLVRHTLGFRLQTQGKRNDISEIAELVMPLGGGPPPFPDDLLDRMRTKPSSSAPYALRVLFDEAEYKEVNSLAEAWFEEIGVPAALRKPANFIRGKLGLEMVRPGQRTDRPPRPPKPKRGRGRPRKKPL